MQKYVISRAIQKMERREIEADNWDEAVEKLEAFIGEPVPDDCVAVYDRSSVEYIGNT